MFNRIISPSQDFMQHKNPNGSAQSTNAKANPISARFRGYANGPGGGLGAAPLAGETINLSDILKSRLWRYLQNFAVLELQTTMFQPVGGMDMIGKAFEPDSCTAASSEGFDRDNPRFGRQHADG
jgi:monoamine oxidase